jgi:hypothetical protein
MDKAGYLAAIYENFVNRERLPRSSIPTRWRITMELASSLSQKNPIDIGERRLWCAVIRSAVEAKDRRFFSERGGLFTKVCELMNLPEEEIRQELLG